MEKDYSKCLNEQQFKMLYIKNNFMKETYVFCIETEETVRGFPDVMTYSPGNCSFYEFKMSDIRGKIHFQPTQPSFYRTHPLMFIEVIALNRKTGKVHRFPANSILQEGNPYAINGRAEADLCKAESL